MRKKKEMIAHMDKLKLIGKSRAKIINFDKLGGMSDGWLTKLSSELDEILRECPYMTLADLSNRLDVFDYKARRSSK